MNLLVPFHNWIQDYPTRSWLPCQRLCSHVYIYDYWSASNSRYIFTVFHRYFRIPLGYPKYSSLFWRLTFGDLLTEILEGQLRMRASGRIHKIIVFKPDSKRERSSSRQHYLSYNFKLKWWHAKSDRE